MVKRIIKAAGVNFVDCIISNHKKCI